jgi:hypothetical protein
MVWGCAGVCAGEKRKGRREEREGRKGTKIVVPGH